MANETFANIVPAILAAGKTLSAGAVGADSIAQYQSIVIYAVAIVVVWSLFRAMFSSNLGELAADVVEIVAYGFLVMGILSQWPFFSGLIASVPDWLTTLVGGSDSSLESSINSQMTLVTKLLDAMFSMNATNGITPNTGVLTGGSGAVDTGALGVGIP